MAKVPALPSVECVLKAEREKFLSEVNAKAIANAAKDEEIISDSVRTDIMNGKSKDDQNYALFSHVCEQATLEMARKLCNIMTGSQGNSRMNTFGKSLLHKLEEVKPRPGSSQVSSAAASDMEAEDSAEQQHTTGMSSRKRSPGRITSVSKRAKEPDPASKDLLYIESIIDKEFERCIQLVINGYKLAEQVPDDPEAIRFIYIRMCQCISKILRPLLADIKGDIGEYCEQDVGHPFKGVSESQLAAIADSSTVYFIMKHLGILVKWLNTTYLEYFIFIATVYDSPESRRANYWLHQYKTVLSGFCCDFLMKNLPGRFYEQLNSMPFVHMKHHCMLSVVYRHDYNKFTLDDLRKETAFLGQLFNLPPDVISYLQSGESNSTTVYWAFDMSYVLHILTDVRQLFWPLLEHHVLSLKLKGVMSISLRGRHVSYFIKNALQTGQNLIRQTEVFTRQFHALVGLGVTEHSLENADTVRRRTVYRKFVQSFARKWRKSARPSQAPLDQQEVSTALLKVALERQTPMKESRHSGDKRMGHTEGVSPIHRHSPLELSHPFAGGVDVPTAPAALATQQLLLPPDPPPPSKPQEDKRQEPEKKCAPRKRRPKKGRKEAEHKETQEQLSAQHIQPTTHKVATQPFPIVAEPDPKTSRKGELERKEFEGQLSALSVRHTTHKVAAQPIPLSQETLAAALKRPTIGPAILTSQPGEVFKHPPVADKHENPHGAVTPEKHFHSAVAEVPEEAPYAAAVRFVDHSHSGEGGDFIDEAPATLPEKKGKDKSKGSTVAIKAQCFALICDPCLEELSDNMRMKPLGTCKDKGHIKKMMVQPKVGVFVTVRSRRLPTGQTGKMDPCPYYPNCFKGDMCQLAHGVEELDYWKAMSKSPEQKELCLDCRSQAAEQVLQQCQLIMKHEATTVVYNDPERRQIVPVNWPLNAAELPLNVKFTVKAEHLNTCHDRTMCSLPHHYLEGMILNLWRENTVVTNTRPSLRWFLAELKRAATTYKRMGPLPIEVLSERDERLLEPITRANYLEKLLLLTEWEQHTHMEALEKFNGMHRFVAKSLADLGQRQYHHDHPGGEREEDGYCVLLFMPDLIADHLRQAASWVSMKFQNGDVLEGTVQRLPKYFESNSSLAVKIDQTSSKGRPVQGQNMPVFLTHAPKSQRVHVTFSLKHSYFTSLRNALRLLPPHMVGRLVPDERILRTRGIKETNADVDYPVLDQFDLDDEYQEPACRKLLNASITAPFLITGPFGAGKTRLLATAALRILLHNPKCFILIATHHIKTADQYIEKYFAPFMEVEDFEMKSRLKVVRVVGKDAFFDSKSVAKYTEVVSSMDSATVSKCNLIVTTFGIMLQLQRVLKMNQRPFFTHIFIDEGAQAREPETLGAFSHTGPETKIVIAGDHKQVGPQTSVLGPKARDNGFVVSLVARLHELYRQENLKKAAGPYQAVMLTNHRSHPSILCLPNSLFYDCSLQASSKSQLHPDYRNSLQFVCTSLDDSSWYKDEVYNEQVKKEVAAAGEWVEKFIDDKNWPEVEWGPKDLSTLCVVVPNKHMEREWRDYARQYDHRHRIKRYGEGLRAVTCNVAYDIQGREFRAVFICTSEAVDEHCATRDPVKSLCDQYVFNTVITRACSLVVAIGNPFRLMKIEAVAVNGAADKPKCWQTFVFRCLQCRSLLLTEELIFVRQSSPKKASEQRKSLLKLEDIMFREARKGLKRLSQTPDDFGDSIAQAYNEGFARKHQKLALASNPKVGTLEWTAGTGAVSQPPKLIVKETVRDVVCYRLWQSKRTLCTAVPVDPANKISYHIIGVHNRKCAFNGALVEIEVMNEESRHAKVVDVLEQGILHPMICVVDSFDPTIFIPVDKKSPRLSNLPHVSRELIGGDSSDDEFAKDFRKNQEQKAPYVICFDPLNLEHGKVPKISHIISKEVAQHLLFVVCPVQWAPKKLYPLGAVVAVLPKGSSELYSCKVLSIEHHFPDHESDGTSDPEQDKLHGMILPKKVDLPAVYTDAIGIISRGGYSSLALSVDEVEDSYEVGIHVSNAADLVSTSDEFHEYKFDRWAAMFGQCQGETVYHAALPEQDLVKALEFTCDAARRSITLKMKVSALKHGKLINAVISKQVLRSPQSVDLEVVGQGLEESTVQCDKMLDLPTLHKMLLALLRGDVRKGSEEETLQKKITVLYAVADELCLSRQGHRGYPELQQTQQAFMYPEAWKMVHELVTYAHMEAADHIGAVPVFRPRTLLQAQRPPLDGSIKGITDLSFYSILDQICFFQKLDLPSHRGRQSQHQPVVCTRSHYMDLIRALERADVTTVRQLLMQPHRYPQLGVLEAMIKDALPREEYVVKRISSKDKKSDTSKHPVHELLEKAGGKHYSLRAVVAPYTSPFDSIYDIYIQDMLTRAIRSSGMASTETGEAVDQHEEDKLQEANQVQRLHKMARLCNSALANARGYESSMTSVDLAVYAQHSSICVEAFVKGMEDGIIQLSYPAPSLQGIVSIQTIKTKLVTKSDKASSAVYTARVTCIDGPCVMRDLKYTTAVEGGSVPMVVFYHKEDHLARYDIVPEYAPPTVTLSPESIQLAMAFLQNSTREAASKLKQVLNDEQQHQQEGTAPEQDAPGAEQGPPCELIQEAPFFILNVPFRLKTGQVVKVWLRMDVNEYVLTPKPQLLELKQDVCICLEHNSDIQACFTQCTFADSSTLQYSSREIYFRIWEELVRAEAATNSVGGKEQFLYKEFQLEFSGFRIPPDSTSSDYYCPIEGITAELPKKFLANRQDVFPIEQGCFACIRFDVELKEKEDAALLDKHKEHLHPGATDNHIRTVMHMVVDHVTKMDDKEEKEEVRMTLEERIINADLKVKFKVVGNHNARVSPLMKDVLKKKKPPCEMQLFPMFLPIKKVYQSLRHLERKLPSKSLGEAVILGRVDQLVGHHGCSKYSREGRDKEKLMKLLQDPNVLCHQSDSGRTLLNDEQITALVFSLMNKFQLIQGPPGTGKSITGAHIAYAFVRLNQREAALEAATTSEPVGTAVADSEASRPHLKCVLYCGPSNVSVDVVLNHLHCLPKSSATPLRILRMYGKTIETLYYEGPYYDPDLFVKRDMYDIDKELRQYALHEKVHSREEIKKQRERFVQLRRKGLIPTAEERFQYRELIHQAEEDIIKNGRFDIVLCTCNETTGYRFKSNIAPIQCIIDEAGMTTEPEAVVALSQAEQVVLIGDHMQLQPVVKNRLAGDNGLRVSLFERYANLLKREFPEGCVNFQQLLKQYRMVQPICDFPSHAFYNGKLETVREDVNMIPANFWPHSDPIAFVDIVGKEEDNEKEEDMKTSKLNEEEAKTVVNVVEALDALLPPKASIAVISPYKAQKNLIEGKLKPKRMKADWRVQTVDASQGSEADYVVLSMVRSKPLKMIKDKTAVLADRKWRMENLGIVADSHHLCVALTRARFGLVIIGNKTLLSYNGTWNELICHYTECRYVVDKQWAKTALDRVKPARKQPPPPPSKRERPIPRLQDAKIKELVSTAVQAHVKFVAEGSQKKPQMLKTLRKPIVPAPS